MVIDTLASRTAMELRRGAALLRKEFLESVTDTRFRRGSLTYFLVLTLATALTLGTARAQLWTVARGQLLFLLCAYASVLASTSAVHSMLVEFERKSLLMLLCSPVRPGTVVAVKAVSAASVGFVFALLVVIVGNIVVGSSWRTNFSIVDARVLSAGTALWSAGLVGGAVGCLAFSCQPGIGLSRVLSNIVSMAVIFAAARWVGLFEPGVAKDRLVIAALLAHLAFLLGTVASGWLLRRDRVCRWM